jgi:adenylate cyclase
MEAKKLRKRQILALAIPLASGIAFAALSLVPAWRNAERAVYDLFLRLKPAVREDPAIAFLDIDDDAIDEVGMYPWQRSIIADGLVSMRELGVRYAVFDIEYVNRSAMGVDYAYLAGDLKTQFALSSKDVKQGFADIMNGLANRTLDLKAAIDFSRDVIGYVDTVNDELYGKVAALAIDNDAELGRAMRLMGGTYSTVNQQEGAVLDPDPDVPRIARERFALALSGGLEYAPSYPDALYPIRPVVEGSRGAGFTNVEVDADGKRRRIALVSNIEGAAYAQLILSPLLDMLGNPAVSLGPGSLGISGGRIVRRPGSVKLAGAAYPDGKKRDVRIPLDEGGFMLINWPKKTFAKSFEKQHQSFLRLVHLRSRERQLSTELSKWASSEVWQYAPSGEALPRAVAELWNGAEAARGTALDSGAEDAVEAFLAAKEEAVLGVRDYAAGAFEAEGLETLASLKAGTKDPSAKEAIAALEADYVQTAANIRDLVKGMSEGYESREALKGILGGKICVIGWTSTATTDMGANPFQKDYVNVGTHAAVANTILNRDFLSESPSWLSALLALVLPLAFILLTRRLRPAVQNGVGISVAVGIVPVSFAIFLFTGWFLAPVAPVLALLLASIGYSIMTFIITEKEKSFLRKAFGTYLSGAVIDKIVADPSQLKLGGQHRWMTAMFTDIRGFSTVSEQLDAERLVSLLNQYLTAMSDIVLEKGGTIDKYEGDAIIAFFNAPLDLPRHAAAAIGAAVLMKRKEKDLNARFLAEGAAPSPLLTRIGVNTGEMVVGNMGTQRKMDYTIMGNAVNLAARLEGVNKQYNSWILASDAAYKETEGEFLARMLDRVQVVGIHTPVRLWGIVDFAAEADEGTKSLVSEFNAAMDLFERRDWESAGKAFRAILERDPDDGPSQIYAKRCADPEFIKRAARPGWDGVFTLSEK